MRSFQPFQPPTFSSLAAANSGAELDERTEKREDKPTECTSQDLPPLGSISYSLPPFYPPLPLTSPMRIFVPILPLPKKLTCFPSSPCPSLTQYTISFSRPFILLWACLCKVQRPADASRRDDKRAGVEIIRHEHTSIVELRMIELYGLNQAASLLSRTPARQIASSMR